MVALLFYAIGFCARGFCKRLADKCKPTEAAGCCDWLRENNLNISIDNALGIHPAALQLRTLRTSVLGNNTAQADTPGYQARDFNFSAELAKRTGGAAQDGGAMRRTDSRHAAQRNQVALSGPSSSSTQPQLQYRTPLMPSVDGNTVNVHHEQAAFARNNIELQASLQFLSGKIRGTLTAIKGE